MRPSSTVRAEAVLHPTSARRDDPCKEEDADRTEDSAAYGLGLRRFFGWLWDGLRGVLRTSGAGPVIEEACQEGTSDAEEDPRGYKPVLPGAH